MQCKPASGVFAQIFLMRRLLPHLFYLSLITGLGIFFWLRLRDENQLIALLNRPTDEAQTVSGLMIGQIQKVISRIAREYPSPKNSELEQRALKADSLIRSSDKDHDNLDSLSLRLEMMTVPNAWPPPTFQKLLPPYPKTFSNPDYQKIGSQSDSLRRQLALVELLQFYPEQMSGLDMRFDAIQLAVSSTIICQPSGSPFEMEIFLSRSYGPELIQMSVNDQSLQHKDGLAHLVHTFPKPGIYPLRVTAEGKFWETDSLMRTDKTFYFHVSQ